jgi:glycosyltransferase involved in cell wall biosynthesis
MGYWTALAYQYSEVVKRLINTEGTIPDIIEVQDYNAIGYYVLQRKFALELEFKNLKIVVHLHTPTFELARVNQTARYKFPTYWIGQMEKFCLNAADALVTQSHFLAKQLTPYAGKKEIKIIPLPFAQQEQIIAPFKYDMLYIGRFEYRKGVVQLLEKVHTLWEKGIEFKLCMLGGDTLFAPKKIMLREFLIKKYQRWIDKGCLVFKDSVPPLQLNHEIAQARIVVIPSLYENYPYTCLTSMALAKPMLVSRSGGQAEMVGDDESCGLIFDWDKEGDFETQAARLLSMPIETLNQIGANAKERISELSNLKNNISQRINFLNSVIEQPAQTIFPIPEYAQRLKNSSSQIEVLEPTKKILSIIIPFYNLGEHIEETLRSAIASDFEDKEIIIINDGSTQSSCLETLDKLKKNYAKNVRVIDIPNGGLANARNVGAHHAKGKYITFLDADDLVKPTFFTRAVDVLEKWSNISFVYSWLEYFEGAHGIWPTFNTELPYLGCANMLSAFCVVRKEDFLHSGLNDVQMAYGMEDFESWIRMVSNGYIGFALPEALVRYRVRSDSMSRQFNRDMILYLYDKLSSANPKIYESYGLEIFNLLTSNGPGYLWNNPTYDYPDIGYSFENTSSVEIASNPFSEKTELMRIASSPLGRKIIKLMFKFKFNRLFG